MVDKWPTSTGANLPDFWSNKGPTRKNHHHPSPTTQGTNPDMDAMLAVPLWGARFIEDVDVVTPLMGATKLEAPSNAAPPRTAPEDTAMMAEITVSNRLRFGSLSYYPPWN